MKKLSCLFLVFFGAVVFVAARGITEEAARGNAKADMSYAFGMVLADELKDMGLEFNYDAFTRGFRDAMENRSTMFSFEEAIEKINAAFTAVQAEAGERNLAEGTAFLAENGKRPGISVTPSGLQFELISEGGGETPTLADMVLVHYQGALVDGTVFDSTYENGEPLEVPLDRVIPGWSEGLRMMREGGKARLYIPPNLAYGERGAGATIGPNAVLIFDVELLSIIRPEASDSGD